MVIANTELTQPIQLGAHVKQLIIVSNYQQVADVIKDVLVFEGYDPIVLSSLEEAVKAFNRGRFRVVLFIDYQNDDDGSIAPIASSILEKTDKTVVMEYIHTKPQFNNSVTIEHSNLHIINRTTKTLPQYNPEELIAILRNVFNQNEGKDEEAKVLKYSNITLDTTNFTLTVSGTKKYITPAQSNLLAYFIENQGAVISKTSLILEYLNKNDVYIWSEYLDDNVKQIQELVGDNPKKPKTIKLIEGIGYYITPETP